MSYRSDLDALRARQDALESEVASRQKDLLETRRMIDEVQQRARLPVLDNIRVAAPCSADWASMPGDERVRACGDCNENVYNLSGMTREEAEALLLEKEGRLCVRYYRRADGTILFNDCEVGVKRRRRRRFVAGAAALLATTGVTAFRATVTTEMGGMQPAPIQGGLSAPAPEVELDQLAEPPEPPEPPVEVMGLPEMPEEHVRPPVVEAESEPPRQARGGKPGRVGGARRGSEPR